MATRWWKAGIVATVALVAASLLQAGPARADSLGVVGVAGLQQPVRLVVDRWGVPHIFARTVPDAFLAQGFNAARDRLFQIDLWRRRGLGLLSEVFGPAYVEQDRATRLFLYRGDMTAEWNSYGPLAKMAATRFANGINAYVDWLDRHPSAVPPEFQRLHYKPARWRPEDVVRIRTHGLTRNLTSEVARSKVTCLGGVDADLVRQGLQPEWRTTVPTGFDPCALPANLLRVFTLATQNVTFTDGRLTTAYDGSQDGSNNWTIAPSHSATGRPILANDPHRAYGAPSLRYIAHLSAPGLNVIGGGEPSSPGISIGHTDKIAYGLTIFPLDQEDLYVYQLDPANPNRYRFGGGWENLRTIKENVPVAGSAPAVVTEQFTRHGPVIAVDPSRNLAYAVRTAWLQPGMSPYFGSLKFLAATSFGQFTSAVRNWGAPTLNFVYADVRGNIGWAPGGLAPKRRGYDGLLPVPGDGRYEWDGFYTGDDLPRSYNPKEGYFATANQLNLPPDFDYKNKKIGFEWTNPARYQRIIQLLSAKPRISLADSGRIQNDQLSLPVQRLVRLLEPLRGNDPDQQAALTLLKGWDGTENADSAPAVLAEIWRKRHLGPAFVKAVVPAAASAIGEPDYRVMVDALSNPSSGRDALLLSTLGAAYAETRKLLGADSSRWRWGALQFTLFEHPVSAGYDVGPFERGGSELTPNASTYDRSSFAQTAGPSFRMVIDVGRWDSSIAVNTPGQSGDPASPHYGDLADYWRTGRYVPLLYSPAAIEAAAEQRIFLIPTRQ